MKSLNSGRWGFRKAANSFKIFKNPFPPTVSIFFCHAIFFRLALKLSRQHHYISVQYTITISAHANIVSKWEISTREKILVWLNFVCHSVVMLIIQMDFPCPLWFFLLMRLSLYKMLYDKNPPPPSVGAFCVWTAAWNETALQTERRVLCTCKKIPRQAAGAL